MIDHSILLRSHYAYQFVYYGLYRNTERMLPFINAMMHHENKEVQQRGAEIACLCYISLDVLEASNLESEIEALAHQAVQGTVGHRAGAAHVYAQNLANSSSERCIHELSKLLDDEEQEVRNMVSGVIRTLRGKHIFSLSEFIEAFAESRSLGAGLHDLAVYLLKNGHLDSEWALRMTHKILDNPHREDNYHWLRGGEELIRLVIRIYNDPTLEDETHHHAIDAFDRLMERFTGQAHAVLEEWDRH